MKVLKNLKNLSTEQKNKIVLFAGIAVAAIILIIGGISLISSKKVEENNKLDVDFTNGNTIVVEKVKDGYKETKKIVVENKTKEEKVYNLSWAKASNNLKVQSDLLYSISSTGNNAGTLGTSQIPVAASPIFKSVRIAAGEKHTYELKVWYKKSNKSVDESKNKFSGTLEIEDIKIINNKDTKKNTSTNINKKQAK